MAFVGLLESLGVRREASDPVVDAERQLLALLEDMRGISDLIDSGRVSAGADKLKQLRAAHAALARRRRRNK